MSEHVRPALVLVVLFTVLTGIAYPLSITGIAGVIAPAQARGSLITRDGKVIGSRLVGQVFSRDSYFWPRPSAAGATGYDGSSSSGSNLGPISQKLADRIRAEVGRYPGEGPVPVDAVTASGSGLDPHVSPENAYRQAGRVAKARGVDIARVRELVKRHVERRALDVIGEPRVNVLELNIAVDDAFPGTSER